MAEEEDINESQEAKTIPILNEQGESMGEFELKTSWLERDKGDQAVQDVVVACLAGRRQGSASTKNRSHVRGSGAKPWRQKGTGRARAGNRSSPIWRGGGVIFGPNPRDYSKKVNAKVRKLALRRTFTSRVDEEAVIAIDKMDLREPKTKSMLQFLNKVDAGEDVLIILENIENSNVLLSSRNLPFVEVMKADSVNVYQLLSHPKIMITSKALDILGTRLA